MSNVTLKCEKVIKKYDDGALGVQVLNGLDLEISQEQSTSIISSSGSDKSTLLYTLGGLDKPSEGCVVLMDSDLRQLNQKQLEYLRNQYLGFAYQSRHLLPKLLALENVMIPLLIGRKPKTEAETQAVATLEEAGLAQRIPYRPSELSGGERRRAAIARVLITCPKCLLADEPVDNLDRKNVRNVLGTMLDLKNELNTSLIVVMHGNGLAVRFERVLVMKDRHLHDKTQV